MQEIWRANRSWCHLGPRHRTLIQTRLLLNDERFVQICILWKRTLLSNSNKAWNIFYCGVLDLSILVCQVEIWKTWYRAAIQIPTVGLQTFSYFSNESLHCDSIYTGGLWVRIFFRPWKWKHNPRNILIPFSEFQLYHMNSMFVNKTLVFPRNPTSYHISFAIRLCVFNKSHDWHASIHN